VGASCFLEIGIFASHIIWLVRTHKIRKEAKVHGKTFDDIAAEHEEQGIPFKFAERKSRKERRRKNDEEKVLPTEESERVQNREEAIFGSEESTQPGRTASRE